MLILILPDTGCGVRVGEGDTECFHSSWVVECMINKELWGRGSETWPWRFGSGLSDVEEGRKEDMRRRRNSRVTPRERDAIVGRGPR